MITGSYRKLLWEKGCNVLASSLHAISCHFFEETKFNSTLSVLESFDVLTCENPVIIGICLCIATGW